MICSAAMTRCRSVAQPRAAIAVIESNTFIPQTNNLSSYQSLISANGGFQRKRPAKSPC
jgi:hypothetical protein